MPFERGNIRSGDSGGVKPFVIDREEEPGEFTDIKAKSSNRMWREVMAIDELLKIQPFIFCDRDILKNIISRIIYGIWTKIGRIQDKLPFRLGRY